MNKWLNKYTGQTVTKETQPGLDFSAVYAKSRVTGDKYRPYTDLDKGSAAWKQAANAEMAKQATDNFNKR